mmetsp:Transcript_108305/g.305341  ORF Transcript_108305/g.305341 Transcript_108305/m.305341 type:complete len:84 (-) Transcript_108305:260-511(-)
MDGDMYESTWEVFVGLYEHVSVGGWIIIDDWSLSGARKATVDFRSCIGATSEMHIVPETSNGKSYWQKERHVDRSKLPCYRLN